MGPNLPSSTPRLELSETCQNEVFQRKTDPKAEFERDLARGKCAKSSLGTIFSLQLACLFLCPTFWGSGWVIGDRLPQPVLLGASE